MLETLSIVGLIFGSLCWFAGYFTGRDTEQRMNRKDEQSLGARILNSKNL